VDEFDIYIRRFRATVAERPERALRRVFGLDEEQARDFVASLPRVVKRRVPDSDRARYEKVLGDMGAELDFRRSPIQPVQTVAVKGVGAGQLQAALPRQPGHSLTLGEPLPEPGWAGAPERSAPGWPAPVASAAPPAPAAVSFQPAGAAAAAAAPAPAPAPVHEPAPVFAVRPAAPTGAELGMAHTQRVETAASAAPRAPAAAAPLGSAGGPRAWTVANTPAAAAGPGEAFGGLPVRGPANPTLRQQPSFGDAAAAPAVSGAEPAPAAPAAAATVRRELEVRPATADVALAEAASLAAGWQDSATVGRAAAQATSQATSPAPAASSPQEAARAYSEASTSDSVKREAPSLRQPSWLVPEGGQRGLAPQSSPPREPADAEGVAHQEAASGWLLSLGGEADARGAAQPRRAPAKPFAQAPAQVRSPGSGPAPAAGRAPAEPSAARAPAVSAAPRAHGGAEPLANLPIGASARPASGLPSRAAGMPSRPAQARPASRAFAAPGGSLPFPLKLLLRVGLGVSLFLLLLTTRSCPLRKSALERELATWEPHAGADEGGGAGAEEGDGAGAGTAARDWIERGNHQFRNPSTGDVLVDKDPIRGLVSRLHRLGAPAVYVYGQQTVDFVVYATGVDVVLPADAAQRTAIFLEEARFHRLDAPSVPDTGQPRLRIAVP
jgi:hypothetical protein